MATGLRQTLAAAIQRSSTTANWAATGSDPSVGNVYMSNAHPAAPAPVPAMPFGFGAPNLFGFFNNAPPPQNPPQMQAPLPTQGQPPPAVSSTFPPEGAGSEEKTHEIERLRRELRKADEKSNFFRNQVITLQQQVSSMGTPVMAQNAMASMPEEIARLRSELAEERAARQSLQHQLQAGGHHHGNGDVAPLQARIWELEKELASLRGERAGGHGMLSAPSTPSRSISGTFGASPAVHGQPREPAPGSPLPHGGHAPSPYGGNLSYRGDALDPHENSGGPRRAVIIGCDYQGKIGTLRAGIADALQWARFFMKRCGLREEDIRLLTDDTSHYQQKECSIATRDNIRRALTWLVARAVQGDQLYFVFCGHGAQIVAEEFAGQKRCENAVVPTDVCAEGDQPRVVSDTDVHKALLRVPGGAQATLVYDCCHAGQPLDRSGLDYLTEYVGRGRVDYDKLKGHPVLPRFLDLQQWKMKPTPAEAVRESMLRCQAVQWAACSNGQFCVELPIDERPRGVFTYMFVQALLKAGVQASSEALLQEMLALTAQLKGRWRLQQDVRMVLSRSTSNMQQFLR